MYEYNRMTVSHLTFVTTLDEDLTKQKQIRQELTKNRSFRFRLSLCVCVAREFFN